MQLNSLLKPQFLVGVLILPCFAANEVNVGPSPLSLDAQDKGLDLTSALDWVECVMSLLSGVITNVETEFKRLFDDIFLDPPCNSA